MHHQKMKVFREARKRERVLGWPRRRGCGCGATITAIKGQGVADVRAALISCVGDGDHTS